MPIRKKSARKTLVEKTPARKAAKISHVTSVPQEASVAPLKTAFRNPRFWVGVGVVVLAVALYLTRGLFVAALVNGQPISRLTVISQLEKQGGKQTLNNLVVEALIRQEAQKRHIVVSQADVDSQMKKIEDQLKGQGVTLDDALSARGMTRGDLISQIQLQAMIDKMVGTSVKITDDDVAAYIAKNQDSLPKDLSDDDLKKQVRTQLEQQQLQEKTQTFVANLQKNAKINYFVNY